MSDPLPEGAAPVSGYCDERFTPVGDAFAANFAGRGEVGASVCIIVDGETVVDLWGGWTDGSRATPWASDTLVDVYSVGKPVVALLALRLVDQGLLGLDDPIASVWPEFAVAGKHAATVRHALCHRAGVPAIRRTMTDHDLWHFDTMVDAVAATEPWWEPGTRHAYHTNTYGHLVGGIIRGVTGQVPGGLLAPLAAELGADVHFGVPAADQGRCADVLWAPATAVPPVDLGGDDGDAAMTWRSYFNPPGYSSVGVANTAEWRAAQVPSTNGHATAGGIAAIYQGLLEPGRLLSPALLTEATSPQSVGFCPILGEVATFGLGFAPTTERRPFGGPSSFGHFGTGGAVGFADPDAGVAFGYAMNHVIPRWQSSRNRALIDALHTVMRH